MPTIPSRPKKQLCKRMFRHMGWDHTCSEQSKGNGEWIHSQKLQVELQMSAAQRVHPHSSAAVSQSCRWMQRSLPARQARSEHRDLQTCMFSFSVSFFSGEQLPNTRGHANNDAPYCNCNTSAPPVCRSIPPHHQPTDKYLATLLQDCLLQSKNNATVQQQE